MALDYLEGATGDPINLKRRVAQQASRTIPATTGFVDFRSNGGPMNITPSEIERMVITGTGAPAQTLPGKVTVEGGPFEIGDVDPANAGLLNFMGNVLKKYTLTNPGGLYYRWVFGLDEATAASPFLTLLNDNDVLPRTRITDLLLGGFTLSASPNENLAISFPFVAGEYDFHGIVTMVDSGTAPAAVTSITQTAGTATVTTTAPHGLTTGDQVLIADAVQTNYNGIKTVTVTGASTYTFAVDSSTVSPATGTITNEYLTNDVPLVKGTWPGNWEPDNGDDLDIYIRVEDITDIADPDDPMIEVTVKIGDAGAWGATDQPIRLGQWNRLWDDTYPLHAGRLGKVAEQVIVRWEEGATVVVGDIYHVPMRRAAWTQEFGAEFPISSINCFFILDNEEIRVEGGWELTAEWTELEAVPNVARKQDYTVERRGSLNVTVSITRRLVDLSFQKRLHEAENVAVVLEAMTDSVISGAAVPYRMLVVMPQLLPTGSMYDVESGATNREEAISLRASDPDDPYVYDGITFTSHIGVVFDTNVATFAG
jgi:hypothetical protein